MPSGYDTWLVFDNLESYDSGTGVRGGMPVYDTLTVYDTPHTPFDYDGFVKAYDRGSQYFDNAEFYDGVVPAYDAIRVFDNPSTYDWPPV